MMVECGICLEQYQEGEIELHRKICVLWLMFRCNICSEDYVNKEGLWNHLDLHEISDESKEAYYREIKAKHRFHECLLCNDKRAYSKCLYDNHVHDVHNGLFLQCSDSRENFRSEQVKNEHAFDQCKVRDQTLASGVYVDQATFNVENKDSEAKHLEAANTELKMEIKVEDTVLQEQKYQLSNEEKGHSSLVPSSEAEWLQIAERYEKVWNVPNCIGSLDGKHIKINVPPNAGSAYFNYKHFHSIILMAMCDADYRFTYIDAGANGRECDGGYFNNSSLSRCLADASLNLPPAKPLPGRNIAVPYVLLADDAFALKPYILKPFPGRALSVSKRLANYRMSRGRRTIENAFGIMSMRYRVLRTHLFDADKTKHITKAICVLHNFHIMRNDPTYAPRLADSCNTQTGEIVEGAWRIEDMNFGCGLRRQSDRDRELNAIEVRNEFMAYFNEEGQVPWQLQSVGMADWNGDD